MGDEEKDLQQDDAEGQRRMIKPDEADQPNDTEGERLRKRLEGDDAEGQGKRLEDDDTEAHGRRKS
jgi:hypothetical protein